MTSKKTLKLTAPISARTKARRALEVRASLPPSKRGGLDAWEAAQLGITSGVTQVARFFSRHRKNVANARAKGLTLRTSKALQAWDLWGGDPMDRFVTREIRRADGT
jgi:hypothetical protein